MQWNSESKTPPQLSILYGALRREISYVFMKSPLSNLMNKGLEFGKKISMYL